MSVVDLAPPAHLAANWLARKTHRPVVPSPGLDHHLDMGAGDIAICADINLGEWIATVGVAYAIHRLGVGIIPLLDKPVALERRRGNVTSFPMGHHSIGTFSWGA